MSVDTHTLTFIDTPGKPSLVKNRVCGISQADAALVVVDVDAGVSPSLLSSLRSLKYLGISSILFAVNKLDKVQEEDVSSTQNQFSRFEHLASELRQKVKGFGDLTILPVSGIFLVFLHLILVAKSGQNLTAKSPSFSWYNGPSLHESLKRLSLPTREWNKPLRITIDHAYSLTGVGTVITGTIVQGVIYDGQYVKVGPINKIVRIRSLHLAVEKRAVKAGYPGDYIGINVSGLHHSECSCRRLGMITGFLQTRERERFLAKDPDVSNAPLKKLSPYCFSREATPTVEELRLAEMRKREAPLHPVSSFKAYISFDSLTDKGIHRQQQLTMHCHNSQVQVDLIKCKRVPRFQHKKKIAERSELDSQLGDFKSLPRELVFYTLQMLPQREVFSTIPQLSKDFLALSTHRLYWQAINKRDGYPSLPIHPRNTWIMSSLTEQTREERILPGEAVIAEIRPLGRPVGLDTYFSCAPLGRFLIRIGADVVGSGKVLDTKFSGAPTEGYWYL